jgi:holo-[acyl-carrier protein] synthase
MTVLRTGIDLVEVDRLVEISEPIRARFLRRVFTPRELAEANEHALPEALNLAYLAGRFAAKEAVAKALGTGIGKVCWQDIEVLRGPDGEPKLALHDAACRRAEELGLETWSLSVSHTRRYATAVAVAMGRG